MHNYIYDRDYLNKILYHTTRNKYKLHIFYYQTSCIIIPRSCKNHEFLENFTHFIFKPRRCPKHTL